MNPIILPLFFIYLFFAVVYDKYRREIYRNLIITCVCGFALFLVAGCSTFKYCEDNICVERSSFINDLVVGDLETQHDVNGKLNIKVGAYQSEQVKGAEAVTRAAVEAAIKAVAPVP